MFLRRLSERRDERDSGSTHDGHLIRDARSFQLDLGWTEAELSLLQPAVLCGGEQIANKMDVRAISFGLRSIIINNAFEA